MPAIELDMRPGDWAGLVEGDPHPWGPGEELAWAEKTRHVGVRDEQGRLLAHAGAVLAHVGVAAEHPFPVVGIGGVIVTPTMRGTGLARAVIQEILRVAEQMGPARAMLFCQPRLRILYERFGFQPIEADVTADQPTGRISMPLSAMWRALDPSADWPSGEVAVLGLPF